MLLCTDPELMVLITLVVILLVAFLFVGRRQSGRNGKHGSTKAEQSQR
jgi:preprotein translocase subunit YajC